MIWRKGYVRFTPESGHVRRNPSFRFGPIADILANMLYIKPGEDRRSRPLIHINALVGKMRS
jgi:hypothetical protein